MVLRQISSGAFSSGAVDSKACGEDNEEKPWARARFFLSKQDMVGMTM